MKHKTLLLPMVFLGFLACSEGVTEPPLTSEDRTPQTVTAADPDKGGGFVEKITGSGHFVTGPLAYNPGVWRTFTMKAKKGADGSVEGSFQILLHVEDGPPIQYEGPISCFTLQGNVAWIGAHLPGNTPSDIAFQVVDNGEGSGSPPDQAGLFVESQLFGLPSGLAQRFCDDTPVIMDEMPPPYNTVPIWALLSDVVGGNIQIHGGGSN